MPYYTKDPKRDRNSDNHPYRCIDKQTSVALRDCGAKGASSPGGKLLAKARQPSDFEAELTSVRSGYKQRFRCRYRFRYKYWI